MRTSVETTPPRPTQKLFSSDDDALGALQRRANRGERERTERLDAERRRSLTPLSRMASTASFRVPITEPSATTIVSASSHR